MRQPELSASSTSRAPSTPTAPDSVGSPPRRATRNSLSQRLSRLVSTAGAPGARAERAALLGVAITRSVTNFIKKVTSAPVRARRPPPPSSTGTPACARCDDQQQANQNNRGVKAERCSSRPPSGCEALRKHDHHAGYVLTQRTCKCSGRGPSRALLP